MPIDVAAAPSDPDEDLDDADPLTGTFVRFSATVGSPADVDAIAVLQDANPAHPTDAHTVTIDWGDGDSTNAGFHRVANGDYHVPATHVYKAAGQYLVSVTFADEVGHSVIVYGTASVTESLSFSAASPTVTASASSMFLGTLTLSEPSRPALLLNAYLDWGGGTTSPVTVFGSGGQFWLVGAPPSYQSGTYPAQLFVVDYGGNLSGNGNYQRYAVNVVIADAKVGDSTSVDFGHVDNNGYFTDFRHRIRFRRRQPDGRYGSRVREPGRNHLKFRT